MLSVYTGDRRISVRIPVAALLLYRAVGMEEFELARVFNVSTRSLEIVSDRALPEGTILTILVPAEGSVKQVYRIVGEVKRVQRRLSGWWHVVMAPNARPWSSMVLFDVVCSTLSPNYGDLQKAGGETERDENGVPAKDQAAESVIRDAATDAPAPRLPTEGCSPVIEGPECPAQNTDGEKTADLVDELTV